MSKFTFAGLGDLDSCHPGLWIGAERLELHLADAPLVCEFYYRKFSITLLFCCNNFKFYSTNIFFLWTLLKQGLEVNCGCSKGSTS